MVDGEPVAGGTTEKEVKLFSGEPGLRAGS